MKAADVMDPHPKVLHPGDTIECAVGYIMRHRYRSLAVVDDSSCYLGMFGVNSLLKQVIPQAVFVHGLQNVSFIHESLEDLYQRYADFRDKPIEEWMSYEIHPVSPDTPLTETLIQLYQTRLSIPVVEHGHCKLLGMISYFDVGEKIIQAGMNGHG